MEPTVDQNTVNHDAVVVSEHQSQRAGPPPAPLHINFFRKEELKQKHEEEEVCTWADVLRWRCSSCRLRFQAERRVAKARRGNPETQTSDARFDESFAFAHRMRGDVARVWR